MSGSSAAMRQLLVVSIFLSGASAAYLVAEQGTLMRRSVDKVESQANTVQLSGAGEVIKLAPEQKEQATLNTCDIDYLEGTPSTDLCLGAHHEHIFSPETCLEAAAEMGVETMGTVADGGDGEKEDDAPDLKYYSTPRLAFTHHPSGCWKGACNKTGGVCVFYNGVPGRPDDPSYAYADIPRPVAPITGTPICRRHRLMKGTVNADGGNGSCPIDYRVVTDETYCGVAAQCLGEADTCAGPGDEYFRIGLRNRSLHDYYPQGCFIRHEDKCVYLNPDYADTGMPSRVIQGGGTPICTIANPADGGKIAAGNTAGNTTMLAQLVAAINKNSQ